jgi:hypothetical protein
VVVVFVKVVVVLVLVLVTVVVVHSCVTVRLRSCPQRLALTPMPLILVYWSNAHAHNFSP